jgi:hypothetical protein
MGRICGLTMVFSANTTVCHTTRFSQERDLTVPFSHILCPHSIYSMQYSKKVTTIPPRTIYRSLPPPQSDRRACDRKHPSCADITALAWGLLYKAAVINHQLNAVQTITNPIATMKKDLLSRFLRRNTLPANSISVFPISQQLFLAGLRCPSDQLQVVAIPLSFGLKGTAIFPARF